MNFLVCTINIDLTSIYLAITGQMGRCFDFLNSVTISFIGSQFTLLQVVMGSLAASIMVGVMTYFRKNHVGDNELFDDDDDIEIGDD